MELTKKNIAQLYLFTRKHYVEWYDLQTELVDHLASDIEEIWKENPQISFEQARDITFKKFGVFGFGEIVEQKQKALSKQYSKMIWKEFKSFFQLPKIILTLFFFIGTYCLFSFFNNGYFIISLLVVSTCLIPLYIIFKQQQRVKKKKKITKKTWLIDGTLLQSNLFPFSIFIPYSGFIDGFFKTHFGSKQLIFLSLVFVTFNLLFYISNEIVRPKMEEKVSELYPEYNIETV